MKVSGTFDSAGAKRIAKEMVHYMMFKQSVYEGGATYSGV